jgi:hypothetical protein
VSGLLNLVAAALVLIPAVRIALFEIKDTRSHISRDLSLAEGAESAVRSGALPNVYYILLDEYTRADVMRHLFDHDNSDFLRSLRDRGFYVAGRSCANYMQTLQSITSALNFSYLEPMFRRFDESHITDGRRQLLRLFRNNRIASTLKQWGYRYVVFETGFWEPENHPVDIVMRARRGFSMFENELVNSTPIATLLTALPVDDQYEQRRRRIRYTLEHLGDTASLRGPLFVFAHILAAHPPFVLDAMGNAIQPGRPFTFSDGNSFFGEGGTPAEYMEGYTGQITFVNRMLIAAIDEILAKSKIEPIIIVQGDHGSRMLFDRLNTDAAKYSQVFPILNAYYLPGTDKHGLYKEISPVNSFRIVLNEYFGGQHPILQDRMFHSDRDELHRFEEISRDEVTPSRGVFHRRSPGPRGKADR